MANVSSIGEQRLIKVLTGMRVWSKVGSWMSENQDRTEPPIVELPLGFLHDVLGPTFFTDCFLDASRWEPNSPLGKNMDRLAEGLLASARESYTSVFETKLPEALTDRQAWYWDPDWQTGEVEADLDTRFGRMKHFASVESLLDDLNKP